jgi:adenylate cyclase
MEPLAELLGESPGIVALRADIARLLQRSRGTSRLLPILIQGETGTGKGLLARAVHRAGPRAAGPFVDINCAAIPETLLEAELFGYERGAFTDARQAKPGLFQAAHRGTLFLDEIGLMPVGLQAKLLKAIEDRAVRRLGGMRTETVDVSIVAATSEDLQVAAHEGRFRPDLYHRLAAFRIVLPPLRERGEDILLLAELFLRRACADYGLAPKTLDAGARSALRGYPWPGNVRELSNLMERVALLAEEPLLTAKVLDLPEAGPAPRERPSPGRTESIHEAMRDHVLDVLRRTDWNISRTAALLGITRNTLRARMEKYGLRRETTVRLASVAPPSTGEATPARRPVATPPDVVSRHVAFLGVSFGASPDVRSSAIPDDCLEIIEEKVTAFGGRVEDVSSTGVVATFGVDPVDDPAASAVHVALAIKNALEHAAGNTARRSNMKAVVHAGDCRVARGPGGYMLDALAKEDPLSTLNTLAERAEPDSVVISPGAIPFLHHRFALARASAGGGEPAPALLVTRVPAVSGKPSIAVMPFRNLTGDPEQDYFGEGITEDIIGALSRLRWLFVIARTSTLAYRSRDVDLRQIADELGVRYVVTGTVRKAGDQLRVTAELVDVDSQMAMWTDRYDGKVADLFEFQEQIVGRIAATLDDKVRVAEIERSMRKRPENLDAYDCVLRALSLAHRLFTPEFFRAEQLLERAISIDPDFAPAYAGRAWWYVLRVAEGISADVDAEMLVARRLAEAALERDPDDPMALTISGHAWSRLSHHYDRALRQFEQALALNPNSAFAWGLSSATFCYIGEPAVARDRALHAMRLSPFDLFGFFFAGLVGLAEMLLGHYEEAVKWAMKSRAEKPKYSANLRKLAACLALLGRVDEAREVGREFLALQTNFRLSDFSQRYPLRDRAALDTYVEGLRLAGLPE